jgi:tRNA-Thr(GGU) m(6)t(6)A37 methyltransferase TsaA
MMRVDAEMEFRPIGYIETAYNDTEHIPRQGSFDKETKGVVCVFPEFSDGLKSLGTFSYCWLIFWFHKTKSYSLLQLPPKDKEPHGVFSIRSPKRPNAIGLTAVRIDKIENDKLYFTGADMINDTPVLDIKPYVEDIDCIKGAGNGWLAKRK